MHFIDLIISMNVQSATIALSVGVARAWAGPGILAQPGSWGFWTPFVGVKFREHLEVKMAKFQASESTIMAIIIEMGEDVMSEKGPFDSTPKIISP